MHPPYYILNVGFTWHIPIYVISYLFILLLSDNELFGDKKKGYFKRSIMGKTLSSHVLYIYSRNLCGKTRRKFSITNIKLGAHTIIGKKAKDMLANNLTKSGRR